MFFELVGKDDQNKVKEKLPILLFCHPPPYSITFFKILKILSNFFATSSSAIALSPSLIF